MLGREEPHVQQTSAEPLVLSPVLLGLTDQLIIFCQVPKSLFILS